MRMIVCHGAVLAGALMLTGCASNDDVRQLERRVAYLEGRLDEMSRHRPGPMPMPMHPPGLGKDDHGAGPRMGPPGHMGPEERRGPGGPPPRDERRDERRDDRREDRPGPPPPR